jgi:hypothetical protein
MMMVKNNYMMGSLYWMDGRQTALRLGMLKLFGADAATCRNSGKERNKYRHQRREKQTHLGRHRAQSPQEDDQSSLVSLEPCCLHCSKTAGRFAGQTRYHSI